MWVRLVLHGGLQGVKVRGWGTDRAPLGCTGKWVSFPNKSSFLGKRTGFALKPALRVCLSMGSPVDGNR